MSWVIMAIGVLLKARPIGVFVWIVDSITFLVISGAAELVTGNR
jgi:hypothetical protein